MGLTIQVPAPAKEIIEKLNAHGFEAFVVGGCVRDSLLDRKPGDWDITTSAKPEEVKAIFGRTIDTGIQHGTVTIMKGKTGYEVTTYRIDGEYEDGRHPKSVEFTSSLSEDLRRRDFTINAMAYSQKSGLVDLFDGMGDLQKRRIKCVGKAEERFTEDALRILRAIRFSAQLDFAIEEETRKAIIKIAPNLALVSKERIQMELTKLLLSDHPDFVKQVFDTGIAPYVSDTFSRIDAEKISINPALPSLKYLRWAALLRHQPAQEAVKILKELKLDNDTISKVRTLVEWWDQPIGDSEPEIRRAMSRMTEELYDSLLALKQSCQAPGAQAPETAEPKPQPPGAQAPETRVPETAEQLEHIKNVSARIRQRGDCVNLKMLAVSGNDLISAGIAPGKAIGETLNRLLQLVLERPEMNEKERLLKEIKST